MTGKEKLKKALAHEDAPLLLDLGGSSTTGIHCSIVEKLRDHYGLDKHPITIAEPMQMLGLVEDDLKEALGVQTRQLPGENNMFGIKQADYKEFMTPWGQLVMVAGEFNTDTAENGDVLLYAQGNRNYAPSARMPKSGFFFDAIDRAPEFDEDEYNVEDNFEEFRPVSDGTLDYFRRMTTKFADCTDAVIGSAGGTAFGDIAHVPGISLLEPKGIRTVEEWYVSTVARPEVLHQIFDHQLEIALSNLPKLAAAIGDTMDVAFVCGTDFGTQKAPFLSTATFDDLYAPYYRVVNDWIHQHTNWKTFKHTCGSIVPLIPKLIDVGFDCLNPVQWTADGMDKQRLKREYGKDIVFWGGGIDTQHTLPFGTPEACYDEALECCKTFGAGGGFVFNTIHNIQANTPVENIAAMVRAVRDFNGEA